MELIFAISLGVVTSAGVHLLLQARTFPIMLGLCLLTYATNLFLFGTGRLVGDAVIVGSKNPLADPIPQALVLTAIVISFATTSYVVVLALRGIAENGNDHVDGAHTEKEPGQ